MRASYSAFCLAICCWRPANRNCMVLEGGGDRGGRKTSLLPLLRTASVSAEEAAEFPRGSALREGEGLGPGPLPAPSSWRRISQEDQGLLLELGDPFSAASRGGALLARVANPTSMLS